MLKLIKYLKRIIVLISILFLSFIFIELLRAYQTLANINSIIAILFITFIIGLLLWAVFPFLRLFITYKRSIHIPIPQKYGGINSDKFKNKYKLFIENYSKNLLKNPNISHNYKLKLQTEFKLISSNSNNFSHKEYIETIDIKIIQPVLIILNEKAELIVKNTVRDSIAGVTLSPFRSFDIYFIIYRNFKMFNQLVNLYNQRPPFSQTVIYLKDVLKIITSVNMLNFTEKFTEKMMGGIPVVSRIADDIIQGIGAGILTTSIGKATIQRCRSYGIWDLEIEKKTFTKTSKDFYIYSRQIFIDDILPTLSNTWVEIWDKIKSAFPKNIVNFDSSFNNNNSSTSQNKNNNSIKIKLKNLFNMFGKNGEMD